MDEADAAADTGDGSWMTYGQLAETRQISRRAAVRLAQRHRLRRQPGNDGSVRVWVPADMAVSSPFRPHPPATPAADIGDTLVADAASFHTQALATLENALRSADARADAALALADRLAAQLADAGDRTERLGRDLATALTAADQARARAHALHGKVEAARMAQAKAEADAAELRIAADRVRAEAQAVRDAAEALRLADAARRGQGRWARLRAAWKAQS